MKLLRAVSSLALLVACFGLSPLARADEPDAPKPRDLGPPLVDNLKELKQFGKYAAWLDPKNKQVVLVGETCKADYPLEFFITTKMRAYESVLVIDGDRREEGKPSVFQQVYLALTLWRQTGASFLLRCQGRQDHRGHRRRGCHRSAVEEQGGQGGKGRRRTWIRDKKTLKPPAKNWVFAGSRFGDDGEGGKVFRGDSGDFVCVLNNPIAMLDLPVVSAGRSKTVRSRPTGKNCPIPGTPVTIILTPKVQAKTGKMEKK